MSTSASYPSDDHASPISYESLFETSAPEPVPEAVKPLSFQEVWRAIMTNPLSRMWAFNIKPPTAYELLLSQELNPFEKSYDIKPQEDTSEYNTLVGKQYHEVFLVCHALSDGTYLGFGLHSACLDVMADPFAGLNPKFGDNTLIVNRLLLLCIEGRMAVVEFCWLTGGALTIRFGPYNSLSNSPAYDLWISHRIYAFSPNDAQVMTACALVSSGTAGAQDVDFVNANFANILLSDHYLVTLDDSRYQEACMFCAAKGLNLCDCPMPMRRRTGDSCNKVAPHLIPPGKTAWSEFPKCKSECAKKGTVIFNLKIGPFSDREVVAFSAVLPFNMKVETNTKSNPTMQQHMQLSGAINPLMTNIHNPGKRTERAGVQAGHLRGHGINNGNPNGLIKFEATRQKRVRQIENVTLPNEENNEIDIIKTITQHVATDEKQAGAVYNIQVIIQPNGNAPQSTVHRNLTVTSNESRAIRKQLPTTSTMSPSNSDKDSMNNGPNTSATSDTGSGTNRNMKRIEKSWDCPECGITIHNKKSNLNRHIEAIHRKKNKSRLTCEERCKDGSLCAATFQTAYNLKRHRKNAHESLKAKQNHSLSRKRTAGTYAVAEPIGAE